MLLVNNTPKLLAAAAVTLLLSGGAFGMNFLEECKSRSAGSFLTEVPAQCLFHPSSRTYVYKGIDCFSCKRLSIISKGQNIRGNSGGGGSDTPGTTGGGTPSGGGSPLSGTDP
ncbi:MAG: hypothetical protein AB8B94_06395 [Hyphomicrobiales bacterium]